MPADILLYALVAAGLVFWLRNILGTRQGDEPQRPNPFTSHPAEKTSEASMKDQRTSNASTEVRGLNPDDMGAELDRSMGFSDNVASTLVDIARIDKSFNLSQFLTGAQDAFVMVVEAFATADRDTLKDLLSPSIFDAFSSVLDVREKDGEKASVEIHAIRKSEIIEASIKNKTAFLTVRFVADETNILRDKDDKVLSGNPDRVTETIDLWTFSRDLKSRNPAWLVTATRDEDAQEGDHTTVPDGGDK